MNRITRNAIKESFDNLPSGVCFFDYNGIAILCNRQMRRLVFDITGTDLQGLDDMQNILCGDAKNATSDRGIFLLPDGSAWRFSSDHVTGADGEIYTQVIASNVSELYQRMDELEHDNRRLREIEERMRQFAANVITITRDEETLTMKMRVHDDLGRSLIATRQLLKQGASSHEFDLTVWKNAVQMLKRDNDAAESRDSFAVLKETAEKIGLEICLEGTLPDNAAVVALIIAALRECATNAVRHADATKLYVKLCCENRLQKVYITNNGIPPHSQTIEGGGLTSLRVKIERGGGSMRVQSMPEFALAVSIPVTKEETP